MYVVFYNKLPCFVPDYLKKISQTWWFSVGGSLQLAVVVLVEHGSPVLAVFNNKLLWFVSELPESITQTYWYDKGRFYSKLST